MQGWSVPNMAETVTWQKPQLQNMHFHKVFDNQEMKGQKHVFVKNQKESNGLVIIWTVGF